MATLSLSGPVLIKAGANVSAVMTADANLEVEGFIEQAEGVVEAVSRYDYTGNWGTISGPAILAQQVVEDLAAIYCIEYDMSGYTSRIEAEDMVNILRDSALRGLSLLRDQKVVTFITT